MSSALVLEGGSLRCMFSAGVVDIFMEHNIEFDSVYGISAGSLTGLNYVANQPERTKRVNVDFVGDNNYLGIKSFILNKSVFNFDYMFGTVSDLFIPLDRKTFESSAMDYTCGATSVDTGEIEYFKKGECSDIYMAIRASSSMPLLSPFVQVEGKNYLDGGIKVAVPYQKAIDDGHDKIIVIPTREHNFRKPFTSKSMASMYARQYSRYPQLVKSLIDTPVMYAKEMAELDKLFHDGRIYTIRPEGPVDVSRMEKDTTKLIRLYNEGRRVGEKNLSAILKYLG